MAFLSATPAFAQSDTDKTEYFIGTVTEIVAEETFTDQDQNYYAQLVKVRRQSDGEIIDLEAGSQFQPIPESQKLGVGQQVVFAHQQITKDMPAYVFVDSYRIPVLVWLFIGFLVLVLLIARKQGAFSIIGMALSLGVLAYQVVPQILQGQNPILVSLIGCTIVAVLTVYLSHGISQESHLALASMMLTLLAVSLLSWVAVHFAHLAGLGSEEAYFLQFAPNANVNLQGLLLAGIMLGTLGVLDDITIAQVSVVTQLKAAKPNIDFAELYTRSLAVGKDHVASLVNTLILAYAGSSLPLFLLFTLSQNQPLWVAINTQMIAEEVIRTLAGSIGLVLAVPLTTLTASIFALRTPGLTPSARSAHAHHHHKH